jgi:F1F0 ATPase subunit 2
MRTSELWTWIALVGAGFFSGVVSFSGLWWSVKRTLERPSRAGWHASGALARFALLAAVFWIATRGDAARLAAVLAGFLVAQVAAIGWGIHGPGGTRRTGRKAR